MSPSELFTPRSSLTPRRLVDIASDSKVSVEGRLDRVGMSRIEMPICLKAEGGMARQVPALIDAWVDLTAPDAKGIHMSRLFLSLQQRVTSQVLTPALVRSLLEGFVTSHEDISSSSALRIAFDHLTLRPALLSGHSGYRSYPVVIEGSLRKGRMSLSLSVQVLYSSTCPCSAALARQLIQEQFIQDFADRSLIDRSEVEDWLLRAESICATPHSQRSRATVQVQLDPAVHGFDFEGLIQLLEDSLQTPVQAAVKREDEQEFARLNGANLMFCEDAARRMKSALNELAQVLDFEIEARHMESLHPHDAVAYASKFGPAD